MSSRSIAEHDLTAPPPTLLPKCQHCGADPAPIVPAFISMGTADAVVFTCAVSTCRAIHGVQLMGFRQQQPQGRIVAPQ